MQVEYPQNQSPQSILNSLESLAPEQRAEVRDFIEFLLLKRIQAEGAKIAMAGSELVCARYWDNADDNGYDAL